MNEKFIHSGLAAGKWQKLSLAEQMGNIGSEVFRAAAAAQGKNEENFQMAAERAFELFDLTLDDPRWKGRLREIARAREVFGDAVYGGKLYGSTLNGLMPYFDWFALAAAKKK
ncbi:MAG: hypothetical protein AAB536_01240 [Patescibacteria group bacterium]